MQWLDPTDCRAARECLDQGNPIEAARILLNSAHREHRAARLLRLEINRVLVAQAKAAHAGGETEAAWEFIQCARRCADISPDAAVLECQIADDVAELKRQRQWAEGRLQQAEQLAGQGRVPSAIELAAALDMTPDAVRLRGDFAERMAKLARYAAECRQHLAHGQLTAARRKLKMARVIHAEAPEVLQLENELRRDEQRQSPAVAPRSASRPITERSISFGLDDYGLVVSATEVVIGNPLGESVQIPIKAKLHRRHVLVVRDRGRYRLVPYSGCATRVNGSEISDATALRHGDTVELGGPHCRWTFLIPVAGSATAVLEQAELAGGGVHTAAGRQYRRVWLLDDRLEVRRCGPAHLILPELACESLCMRWTPAGLTAEVAQGTLRVEGGLADAPTAPSGLWVPGRVVIERELSEAEWLGRALEEGAPPDVLRLRIHPSS